MVKHRKQVGTDGEYAPSFLTTYGSDKLINESMAHPKAVSNQLRHHVEAWLGEISPGTRVYTKDHSGLDLISLGFAFSSSLGETKHFRSTNVGFGISYILPIILVLLSAKPGSLILLENPEAHLHPHGQVKMGELLALASENGVQILVETHSDHLLNGIRLAVHGGHISPDNVGLSFFQREQTGGSISANISSPKIDRAGRIDFWPEGFFDETEKALRQLMRPPVND